MLSANDNIETTSTPRFEFRTFGQNFEYAGHRMARLSVPVPEKLWDYSTEEIYILSRENDINNIKIRNGKLEMKTLLQTVDGFQQWKPSLLEAFPVQQSTLQNLLFPAANVATPKLIYETYSMEEFISLVQGLPGLHPVRVSKRRFAYQVNNTLCETGIILINGALVHTISSESTNTSDIKKTLIDTGLDGTENISYPEALKRVMGIIQKPLAN